MSKEPNNAAKGKRDNQKMKPFFVMEYLLQNSDENKRITADIIRCTGKVNIFAVPITVESWSARLEKVI